MPTGQLAQAKVALKQLNLWRRQRQAKLQAAFKGQRLAPGELKMLPNSSLADQLFFSKEAEKHGPIFKCWWPNKLTTCIVGHEFGRRFLSANEGRIRADTTNFTPLFPHGILRVMEGETHRKYRKTFIEAFRVTPVADHEAEIRSIVDEALDDIARPPVSTTATMRPRLKMATTAISLRLVLGIERTAPLFRELADAYHTYATHEPFLVVHRAAHAVLNRHVGELTRSRQTLEKAPPSLLKALVAAGQIDDTVIGNLIHMTWASLYDTNGLWFWILHMLAADPSIAGKTRMHSRDGMVDRSFAVAVAYEALRMEQSEYIKRSATDDIVFEGCFIPKNSRIRICVWDWHRDPKNFPDPFKFDPARFLGKMPDSDTYSPFGLDKHRCLAANWTIEFAATFVQQLLTRYRLDLVRTGPSERGWFHFEPSTLFELRLQPIATA